MDLVDELAGNQPITKFALSIGVHLTHICWFHSSMVSMRYWFFHSFRSTDYYLELAISIPYSIDVELSLY